MSVRQIVYQCPRCGWFIPASSRAKSRFDSFCPRCNRRITILWPTRKKSIWDDRRGRERLVSYWMFHTRHEALDAAIGANQNAIKLRHMQSRFSQEDIHAGFIPATRLTDEAIQDKKKKQKRDVD